MLYANTFLTIAEPKEVIYKDKGSKFFAFAFPVSDEQSVKTCLQQLKKQYPSANHHCYAYRLGADKLNFRSNDDGEPGNTAGKPILGQIQSNDLTDILIVVVRFFGGTLLGVSGLIHAYKTSAAEVISQCRIIEKHILFSYSVYFNYEQLNDVMKIMKQMDCRIIKQDFDTTCSIQFEVKKSLSEGCENLLRKIEGLQLEYK